MEIPRVLSQALLVSPSWPGPARASSPARPSLDLDHALPSALSPLDQVAKRSNNIEKP
jgi:hypothetical protein